MKEQLEILQKEFLAGLAELKSEAALKELENEFLGKKGKLKAILAGVKDLSIEEKKTVGVAANELKKSFVEKLEAKAVELEEQAFAAIEEKEALDVTV